MKPGKLIHLVRNQKCTLLQPEWHWIPGRCFWSWIWRWLHDPEFNSRVIAFHFHYQQFKVQNTTTHKTIKNELNTQSQKNSRCLFILMIGTEKTVVVPRKSKDPKVRYVLICRIESKFVSKPTPRQKTSCLYDSYQFPTSFLNLTSDTKSW